MQILCEGHNDIVWMSDDFRPAFAPKEIHPEPVLRGDMPEDAFGTSMYGSVIKDGSVYRLWYQAWPDNWNRRDSVQVACVESDDGIVWRKPKYNLVDYKGNKANHLTDLPFHCPSVMIDPHADPSARYRAFGFVNVTTLPESYRHHNLTHYGYYSAHSADGIHWQMDPNAPLWPRADVITSVWDQYADCARVFLKKNVHTGGISRRAIFEASWKDGVVTEEKAILIPDEYDDINAHIQGYKSADYYGMGVMPTEGPTVGFLWNFKHLSYSGSNGVTGAVDISLVFQSRRGDKWCHVYGRPNWLTASEAPDWVRGAIYTSSNPIHVGDETWLYFTGTGEKHGWVGEGREYMEYMKALKSKGGFSQIGRIKWQKDRLFGYKSALRDRIHLQSPTKAFSGTFAVNVHTEPGGCVRAQVLNGSWQPVEGYGFEDCDAFSGDHKAKTITWNGSPTLPMLQNDHVTVAVEVEKGTIYGFDFVR